MKPAFVPCAALVVSLAACAGANEAAAPFPANRDGESVAQGLACRTIDDSRDRFFNELNGINDRHDVAGDDGIGNGYVVKAPYAKRDFTYVHYPNGTATAVTSVNDRGDIAGFYREGKRVNGFFRAVGEVWQSFLGPSKILEILGMNGARRLAGFFTDKHGADRAFGPSGKVRPPGAVGAVASGINRWGDVAGYLELKSGETEGFLLKNGAYAEFAYPGSSDTKALGINRRDEIVGSYVDAAGATHGFILHHPTGEQYWQSFDEPNAAGATILHGIDDHGDLVGAYVDASGNTNGFVCK